jgi:hypothetical protein
MREGYVDLISEESLAETWWIQVNQPPQTFFYVPVWPIRISFCSSALLANVVIAVLAFLSCLFPERRADRVFNLREKRLESIIKQAQGLGSTRLRQLQNWRASDGADFAFCMERLMSATDAETRHGSSVTLEELDETLDGVAATSSSSIDLREGLRQNTRCGSGLMTRYQEYFRDYIVLKPSRRFV